MRPETVAYLCFIEPEKLCSKRRSLMDFIAINAVVAEDSTCCKPLYKDLATMPLRASSERLLHAMVQWWACRDSNPEPRDYESGINAVSL